MAALTQRLSDLAQNDCTVEETRRLVGVRCTPGDEHRAHQVGLPLPVHKVKSAMQQHETMSDFYLLTHVSRAYILLVGMMIYEFREKTTAGVSWQAEKKEVSQDTYLSLDRK